MKSRMPTPAVIWVNGEVRTQDPARPRAEALAVAGDRILAVGRSSDIEALAAADTERVDLEGRLALPGFMDVHFHFYDWALGRLNLDLAPLKSFDGLIAAVETAAADKPAGEWIIGLGFNEAEWPQKRIPTRADLDPVSPGHPVFLLRCDLHLAVANTVALKRAGIDTDARATDDGFIGRDGDNRPSGILRERAVNIVKDTLPKLAAGQAVAAMADGMSAVHAMGITGLHDIRLFGGGDGAAALNAWQSLHRDDRLKLRTWATIAAETLDAALDLGLQTGLGDDRLRIGHVKFYADGGMGARTAWMQSAYLDGGSGMPLIPIDALEAEIRRAHRAGLACAVHAIGDRANREVIGIYAKLTAAGRDARPALPHRIEHLQMVRPRDLERLAGLDVAVNMQPHNAVLDMRMIDDCVGPDARFAYAFADVLASGIPLCFSSDAPVCDPRPLINIQAAVTRCREDGTPAGGWYPGQRVTVADAVAAYTRTPAAVSGAGDELGTLSVGKRADIVVLERDIYTIDPLEIARTGVSMTLFDGQPVYRRGG